jgi:hypothetical protein
VNALVDRWENDIVLAFLWCLVVFGGCGSTISFLLSALNKAAGQV